jgi:hypothetical protein
MNSFITFKLKENTTKEEEEKEDIDEKINPMEINSIGHSLLISILTRYLH